MTVPTNAEGAHFRKSRTVGPVLPLPDTVPARRRRRGLLISGVVAVGLGVVALVLAFPRLAAPIGTAAGVVAVLVPLVPRVGYGEPSDRGSGG
ncbi:hypothetical protein [Streptomyces sp. NPDC017988]|uniref:hypothetical protein n=1 Tax=Streptomyces sp. NPDC017988 TaxID=3365025 RepID=UPI003798C3A4